MFFSFRLPYYSKELENNINKLNAGDVGVIPWIFCVFGESSNKHKLIAAKALNNVLDTLNFSSICKIDREMRQTTSMEWGIDWRQLKINQFLTNAMSMDEKRAVIIFSRFNPNGYIREKSLRLLCKFENTLPYIVLRKNDWVLQVREEAEVSFRKKIETVNEVELLETLPYLEKLRRSSRGSYDELTDIFYKKINGPMGEEVLKKGLKSHEICTRKLCINMFFDTNLSNYSWMIEHLKVEKDPFLRKMIFIRLSKRKIDVLEIAKQFLQDKFPANRLIALQYLYNNKREIVLHEAENMIFDKNPYVRKLAREILEDINPDADVHKIYLDNLPTNTVTGILGLGETGSVEDCKLIEQYLYNDNCSIVRSSMIALMALDANNYKSKVTDKLLSQQSSIVKMAKLLIEKYNVENFTDIFEIYKKTLYENNKIKCTKLLFKAPKWQRLIYMLITLKSQYESVNLLSTEGINSWLKSFNSSFIKPTDQERETIITLVNEDKNTLDIGVKKQLLFILK